LKKLGDPNQPPFKGVNEYNYKKNKLKRQGKESLVACNLEKN